MRPQTTSLIGRGSAVAELQGTVRAHRLVTLTGVGGVGKTRLALEVATQLADEFPDGIWLFELGAVADPAAVPDAVAAVLGITQQPGKTVSESVATALEGQVRLLVFDNCEHVLDAVADLIVAILAHSGTVTILATSREGVGHDEEQLWQVPPLDADSAVDLFIERARRVAPAFSADDAGACAEICRRLDGIPFAIELAASRISSMAVDEVRDRLDHRFKLLVGSRRGLARHQTLRHAVAWSYDLLDDTEKALLERCSVFAGGFDLQSACAIDGSDDIDEYVVLDLLDALVRKSLLVADRSAGRTRFSMLDRGGQGFRCGDDSPVGEEQLAPAVSHRGRVRRMPTTSLAKKPTFCAVGQPPTTRRLHLVHHRVGQSTHRVSVGRRPPQPRRCRHHRHRRGIPRRLRRKLRARRWAEELIETARAVDHRRLVFLYAMATQCWFVGRIEEAVRYTSAGRR